MNIVFLLLAAIATATAVIWRAVPEARRRRAEEDGAGPFELSGPTAATVPAFVFQPAEAREDLPPKPISIARLVVTVVVLAGVVAALAWAAGTYVNGQLARMLQP